MASNSLHSISHTFGIIGQVVIKFLSTPGKEVILLGCCHAGPSG